MKFFTKSARPSDTLKPSGTSNAWLALTVQHLLDPRAAQEAGELCQNFCKASEIICNFVALTKET